MLSHPWALFALWVIKKIDLKLLILSSQNEETSSNLVNLFRFYLVPSTIILLTREYANHCFIIKLWMLLLKLWVAQKKETSILTSLRHEASCRNIKSHSTLFYNMLKCQILLKDFWVLLGPYFNLWYTSWQTWCGEFGTLTYYSSFWP